VTSAIKVLKVDGRIEEFKADKLISSVRRAADEANASVDLAVDRVLDGVVDVVTARELMDRLHLHLLSRVPVDVKYGRVASTHLLGFIRKQVLGKEWLASRSEEGYRVGFVKFIERGAELGILDREAVSYYRDHLEELARYIRMDRDYELTYNALRVLASRYLLVDPETGRFLETPQYMFMRVAMGVAYAELKHGGDPVYWAKRFYDEMSQLKFLPNSPTLFNSLTKNGVLSACFVVRVDDCISKLTNEDDPYCAIGIYDALLLTAELHKYGAGTGYDFSKLRPEGDVVRSTTGVASGPISFMRLFDVSTDVIKQGGKRRGAMMGILQDWHLDLEKFIRSKSGEFKDVQLQNFNISVMVHDLFMRKALGLSEDSSWILLNPRELRSHGIDLVESWGEDWEGRYLKAVEMCERGVVRRCAKSDAKRLFETMVKSAWDGGDPGILFIDSINTSHPNKHIGTIHATNPCGEVPLLDMESCNLGSINLAKFVRGNDLDWTSLADTVGVAVRFLDDVITVNKYPHKLFEEANRRTRKIGLGVMGLAEALIQLNIPYASWSAVELSARIMSFIYYHAVRTSVELARERGPYPAFEGSDWSKGVIPVEEHLLRVKRMAEIASKVPRFNSIFRKFLAIVEQAYREFDWEELRRSVVKGVRNGALASIAPTGSISIIAGTTSGIEPLFALALIRNVAVGKLIEFYEPFMQYAISRGIWDKAISYVVEDGSIAKAPVPEHVKRLFATAHEIHWTWHVLVQAAFQAFNDQGTSKTINMPSNATVDDVKNAYVLAWLLGVKGITVFRDASKRVQVIYRGFREGFGRGFNARKIRVRRKVEPEEYLEEVVEGGGLKSIGEGADPYCELGECG